jgi:hypothetical protein
MTILDALEEGQLKASREWPYSIAQIERTDPDTLETDPWFFAAGPEVLNIHQATRDSKFAEILMVNAEELIALARMVQDFVHRTTSEQRRASMAAMHAIVERLERTL